FFLKEKTFEGIDIKRLKEDIKESLCGQRLEVFLNLLKPLSLALDKESQKDLI
ncbi:MAG: hypothetical protein HY279_06130, partial [Nitrospinae bacterium]|nr:hypothetical protein [Nitrospinota bacterium]